MSFRLIVRAGSLSRFRSSQREKRGHQEQDPGHRKDGESLLGSQVNKIFKETKSRRVNSRVFFFAGRSLNRCCNSRVSLRRARCRWAPSREERRHSATVSKKKKAAIRLSTNQCHFFSIFRSPAWLFAQPQDHLVRRGQGELTSHVRTSNSVCHSRVGTFPGS